MVAVERGLLEGEQKSEKNKGGSTLGTQRSFGSFRAVGNALLAADEHCS